MAKRFKIFNPGPNPAKHVVPGIGTFEIQAGKSIELNDESLARALVNDSAKPDGTPALQLTEI